ncbi:unnamed protein product [Heterobilharzia americana]|nr:unnamed protein product [Heterobilharzia americana]
MDLSLALGSKCIDFDFGSPQLASKRGLSEVQAQDCCLFLLYETGDVIQVCECLSVRNVNQLKINVLHILPPSIDNYGDGFCAIHCIRPVDIQEMFPFEKPPDLLVLADKFGRLHNGIVLRTNLPSQNKNVMQTSSNPSVLLCLVDIVDLDLTTNEIICQEEKSFQRNEAGYYHTSDDILHSSNCAEYDQFGSGSLSLEPAHLCFLDNVEFNYSIAGCDFVKNRILGMKYSHEGYYVIHHMGIHLVSLPWMKNLSLWCSEFNNELLRDSEKYAIEGIRDWQSCVKHLFVVPSGLMIESTSKLESRTVGKSNVSRPPRSVTLLLVRAPIQSIESNASGTDHSYLVQSISLTLKPDVYMKQQRYDGSDLRASGKCGSSYASGRSDFTSHIHQILSDDDSHFPVITALNLQPGLTQQQLVQFFIKVSDALRKGPLDRLMKARSFIEQHSRRLQDLLLAQYSETAKLCSKRQNLQSRAEDLAKRQAVITERQAMLDKRMATLASRLAGLGEGPTKAEIAMHSEVLVIRDRLHKGLRQWLSTLQNRRTKLERQMLLFRKIDKSSIRGSFPGIFLKTEDSSEGNQWEVVSDELRRETVEIKMLINAVKTLNTKTINPV